jgi:hypothetical protein
MQRGVVSFGRLKAGQVRMHIKMPRRFPFRALVWIGCFATLSDQGQQGIQAFLGITVEHPRVFFEEQGVLDARIARALAALGHDYHLGLPTL